MRINKQQKREPVLELVPDSESSNGDHINSYSQFLEKYHGCILYTHYPNCYSKIETRYNFLEFGLITFYISIISRNSPFLNLQQPTLLRPKIEKREQITVHWIGT